MQNNLLQWIGYITNNRQCYDVIEMAITEEAEVRRNQKIRSLVRSIKIFNTRPVLDIASINVLIFKNKQTLKIYLSKFNLLLS